MADLFTEIVPSILQTKVNYLRDDVDLKEYSPFMVNRALSYHMDCVLYANEMNKHHSIDKDMQYQYLLNTIRSMKRKFQPWQKSEKEKDIDCVKTYFSYSNQKAKDALRVLSKEQISQIKELVDIGGTQKNTK